MFSRNTKDIALLYRKDADADADIILYKKNFVLFLNIFDHVSNLVSKITHKEGCQMKQLST